MTVSMINLSRFKHLNNKNAYSIFLIFLVLSIGIGYLISPKMIFKPITYREGDIILQTVQITKNVLVPDKISTQLKRDKLLEDQRRIYDYDPQIFEKTCGGRDHFPGAGCGPYGPLIQGANALGVHCGKGSRLAGGTVKGQRIRVRLFEGRAAGRGPLRGPREE